MRIRPFPGSAPLAALIAVIALLPAPVAVPAAVSEPVLPPDRLRLFDAPIPGDARREATHHAAYGLAPPAERTDPETFTGPGFTGHAPPGAHWKPDIGRSYLAFTRATPEAIELAARGQTFVIMITLTDAAYARGTTAESFPEAFETETRRATRGRFRLVDITATPRASAGNRCVDYALRMGERDDPDLPGAELVIETRGVACLEASSTFIVNAFYSERRPNGTPTMVDAKLRGQGEMFLRNLIVHPEYAR
ncbi:hypothetical protein [Thioalkalivibrio thiocyanodenitrificans]|uniref:hypothetical protein n=1 Tax=Thioalkalivibrio thiocyanodenitrificans TaxID=243063 RepID=UPI0012EA8B81|nr:hypothetical protein [Thioalkalivibrio thiocyanodenitrificans]